MKYKTLKEMPYIKIGSIGEIENGYFFFRNKGIGMSPLPASKEYLIDQGWIEEVKELVCFVPKKGEKYYQILSNGNIVNYLAQHFIYNESEIEVGNCFKTEQDAQDCLDNYIRPAFLKYWEDKK